ncbi:MAG: peroxidase-related enzyme [Chloroflexi bacterium]|nr:peroxidase-related enzyme [Chloroflexota bacterium]
MEAHAHDLREECHDDELVRAIKTDFRTATIDAATRAMLEFAEKSTLHPSSMTPADLDRLRACGFSDKDLLDIVHITAYFNYINRVADAVGIDPESDFEPVERVTPGRADLLKKALETV